MSVRWDAGSAPFEYSITSRVALDRRRRAVPGAYLTARSACERL